MKLRVAIAVSVSFVVPSVPVLRAAANRAGAPPRPLSVLAAGDSFTSGHGVPGSTFDPCHTAMTAWPFRAVQDTGLPIEAGGITFKACSGARTTDFASQWDGHTKYDLVMFTFGGDDLDFGGVMLQCLNLDPHFYLPL